MFFGVPPLAVYNHNAVGDMAIFKLYTQKYLTNGK